MKLIVNSGLSSNRCLVVWVYNELLLYGLIHVLNRVLEGQGLESVVFLVELTGNT
jgi:hypothetical protein